MRTFDLGAVTAYAIAVKHGFEGTEAEWIAHLEAQAKKYEDGAREAEANAKASETAAERSARDAAAASGHAAAHEANAETAAGQASRYAQQAELAAKNTAGNMDYFHNLDASARESRAMAEYYKERAAESAEKAKTSETNATTSETNAAKSAEEAKKAAEFAISGTGADWNAPAGEPGHVLNRTHWVEGDMVEILPETTLESQDADGGINVFLCMEAIPVTPGETYTVNWNGKEYSCIGISVSDGDAVGLGNMAIMAAGDDTGEPFVMAILANGAEIYGNDGATSVTLSIYQDNTVIHKLPGKFLPDGVPYMGYGGMVEVYPETTLDFSNDDEVTISDGVALASGAEYTVIWNGVEYKCVAQDVSAMMDGVQCNVLGNMRFMGGADTGEPFIMILVHPDAVATVGMGGFVSALDGPTSATFSIMGREVIYHKIPQQCLPDSLNGVAKQFLVNVQYDENSGATADKTFDEITMAAVLGAIVRARITNGNYVYLAPLVGYSNAYAYFSVYLGVVNEYRNVTFGSDGTVTVQ